MNAISIAVAALSLNLALLLTGLVRIPSGQPQEEAPVLRGRALELVDNRGQIRARLDVEPSGEVVFRLLDRGGTIRVKLGAGEDGSGLLLANDATEPGVHLLAGAGGSSVKLANKDGRERLITP
jgi:hypothetical protein